MSEKARKCGYRKIGGTYIVSDPGFELPCVTIPYNVTTCPCCFEGIKFSRGFKWFIPEKLFDKIDKVCTSLVRSMCIMRTNCPFRSKDKAGIMWVGEKFYTPETFLEECINQGISKRIASIPRDFKVNKTWVFLAHRKAGVDKDKKVSAIFYVFKPTRIERIVTTSEYKDKEKMDKLKKEGITPVAIDENNIEHTGGTYKQIHKQKSLLG